MSPETAPTQARFKTTDASNSTSFGPHTHTRGSMTLTADDTWSYIATGDHDVWGDADVPDDRITQLGLSRNSVHGLIVAAQTTVYFEDLLPGMPENESAQITGEQNLVVQEWLQDKYDLQECQVAFGAVVATAATPESALDAGESFPADIAGLTQMAVDKSGIGQLHADMRSGAVTKGVRARLVAAAAEKIVADAAAVVRQAAGAKTYIAAVAADRADALAQSRAAAPLTDEQKRYWDDDLALQPMSHADQLACCVRGTGDPGTLARSEFLEQDVQHILANHESPRVRMTMLSSEFATEETIVRSFENPVIEVEEGIRPKASHAGIAGNYATPDHILEVLASAGPDAYAAGANLKRRSPLWSRRTPRQMQARTAQERGH